MRMWQMHDAKARLSDVVKRAGSDGPQHITLHGRTVAVVLSHDAYERLSGRRASMLEFMQTSPLAGLDDLPVFERDPGLARDVAL